MPVPTHDLYISYQIGLYSPAIWNMTIFNNTQQQPNLVRGGMENTNTLFTIISFKDNLSNHYICLYIKNEDDIGLKIKW